MSTETKPVSMNLIWKRRSTELNNVLPLCHDISPSVGGEAQW